MLRLKQTVAIFVLCLGVGAEPLSFTELKEIWRIRQSILTCTNKLNYGCSCNETTIDNCNFFCIPLEKRCNGEVDCPDGDDETDCPPDPCAKGQVCCLDGVCASVCDGNMECSNEADEENCEPPVPSECPGRMQCPSGVCATLCDGDVECEERRDCGEDEKDCRFICPDRQIVCNTTGECGTLCDSRVECPDGKDESVCYIECAPDQVSCELNESSARGCVELCEGADCETNWDEDDVYCGFCSNCGIANAGPVLACAKRDTCP